eukprot:CAMPEP_0182877688 /NCGR_PEP_ID=MMETSP0034_2-20130328/14901_1 /TAXON_ID=156128 /ORGANISM="Nephroselmis pyriformis, Strain CCMP717" /LENGTH=921 /DNA_ID=CAMNT_0025010539 /DNA_START=45 /DNA_END=2810 /DNA_ORIENTATION=-
MAGKGRVMVFARTRPPIAREDGDREAVHMDVDANRCELHFEEGDAIDDVLRGKEAKAIEVKKKGYDFDAVFAPESNQKDVYAVVGKPVLKDVLLGYNGSILAYGQTGAGKTHSLLNAGADNPTDAGLLPRLVAALFVTIATDTAHAFEVKAAMFQIYNEQIDDLLVDDRSSQGNNLNIKQGGLVDGLSWIGVRNPDECMKLFSKGRANIIYAETKMNKASSRSHSVFQFKITKRPIAKAGETVKATFGKLTVVDLAGSERIKKSGAEGQTFKEATNINSSLLAFGNVVQALASKAKHVPFRDSKLTRILEDSVGGNCKTSLLVCTSPSVESLNETQNTLEFASRAMRIETTAVVNEGNLTIDAAALAAEVSKSELNAALSAKDAEMNRMKQALEDDSRAKAEEIAKAKKQAEAMSKEGSKALAEKDKQIDALKAKLGNEEKSHAGTKSEMEKRMAVMEKKVKEAEEAGAAKAAAAAADAKGKEMAKRIAALEEQLAEVRKMAQARGDAEKAALAKVEALLRGEGEMADKMSAAKAAWEAEIAQKHAQQLAQAEAQAAAAAAKAGAAVSKLQEDLGRAKDALAAAAQKAESDARSATDAAESKRRADLAAAASEASDRYAALEAKTAAAAQSAAVEISTMKSEIHALHRDIEDRDAGHKKALRAAEDRFNALLEDADRRAREGMSATEATAAGQLAQARAHAEQEMAAAEARLAGLTEEAARRAKELEEEMRQREEEHARAVALEKAEAAASLRNAMAHHETEVAKLQEASAAEAHALTRLAETRLKRTASAFSAARTMLEDHDRELTAAYHDLKTRFAARESRADDIRRIAELEREIKVIEARQGQAVEQQQQLNLQLANRDAADRMFGGGGPAKAAPGVRQPPLQEQNARSQTRGAKSMAEASRLASAGRSRPRTAYPSY